MPPWFCAILHPGQTLLAVQALQRQGFRTHLPIFRSNPLETDKPPRWRALFPGGYIFISMQSVKRWQVLFSTYGISSILRAGDELLPVPHRLLVLIDELAKNGGIIPPDPEPIPDSEPIVEMEQPVEAPAPIHLPPAYAAGEEVEIINGPLASVRGIISWSDDARVRLLLSFFGGRPMEQELAAADIRRLKT